MKQMLCVKTNDGIYVNRVELIDVLEEIDSYYASLLNKRWKFWKRKDQSITQVVRLLTSFGEPPNAEDGDGGSLTFPVKIGIILPEIQWRYCANIGVCLRVVDLLQFIVHLPLSENPLRVVMHCLLNTLSKEFTEMPEDE